MPQSSQTPEASGAWALLVNADGSDEWLEQCNEALAEVQREARRKALREAIDAARSELLTDNTGTDADVAYNQAIYDVVTAIENAGDGAAS